MMAKQTLLLIATCTLANAGCQPAPVATLLPADVPSAPSTLVLAAPLAPYAHFAKFRVTRLGKTETLGAPVAINGLGQVLFPGYFYNGHRVVPLQNPTKDTDTPTVEAHSLNDAGVAVGDAAGTSEGAIMSYNFVAFSWQNGNATELKFPQFDSYAIPTGINARGDMAVNYLDDAGREGTDNAKAFVYQGGHLTLIGRGDAKGINDKGQILVCQARSDDNNEPDETSLRIDLGSYLWDSGKKTPIRMPLGYVASTEPEGAVSLNNAAQVVGSMKGPIGTPLPRIRHIPPKHTPPDLHDLAQAQQEFASVTAASDDQRHAFLWDAAVTTDLGTLGGSMSEAKAINNKTQVVGSADTGSQETHAFLWQQGRMYDLNNLISRNSGWVLTEADAINDKGQIVGVGNKGAFLLTPMARNEHER